MSQVFFHVTPTANRESIARHGLDWRHMTHAGIAGSERPERQGIFLVEGLDEARFFVEMGERRGVAPIDVWRVELPDDSSIAETDEGFLCHMASIPRHRLRLLTAEEL